jgi:hypothetical protein
MSRILDTVVVYRILRLLATPIEQSDAYKSGIVDKDGKKIKNPETYSILNRFVFKVQRALMRSNDRNARRLLTFAAAIAILKEDQNNLTVSEDVLLEMLDSYEEDAAVQRQAKLLESEVVSFKNFIEDVAVNSAGAGGIAGIGTGPISQREPGRDPVFQPMLRRKKQKKKGNCCDEC